MKEENDKLNVELANMQNKKETSEVELKAKEKIDKIKENTKLFNKIIKEKVQSGEYQDIDISKYVDEEMEECDGGDVSSETTGYGSLNRIIMNKKLGGKRSSPQEESSVVKQKSVRKQTKLQKCSQCDFMTQNEQYFNEHMSNVHANLPTCPFCLKVFNSYSEVRKHCETKHSEGNKIEQPKNIKKKPCRYFRNGTGRCQPPSGMCSFDHSIIPDNERELCHHKQDCRYKPYCIFLHPEGQLEQKWQPVRKNAARICVFTVNGGTCTRQVCHFFHPSVQDEQISMSRLGFHKQSLKKPPLIPQQNMSLTSIPLLPMRVPVIVWNKKDSTDTMVRNLSQKLEETSLL